MKTMSIIASAFAALALTACNDEIEMRYPPKFELPELPVVEDIHTYKAPLYWSVYEYCYERECQGVTEIDITVEEWDKIIDWVATDLKPYGYDMICTDGFVAMLSKDDTGYMTHYGSISLKDLVAKCKAKGLKVGIYDNPLWIHGPRETKIEGTDYTFGSLYYNGTTDVMNPSAEDRWFHWVVADNPGAKEYIDGFFKYYKELGVDYIRMDFLSWYEDGKDRGMGLVGRGYGRASYGRALSYIAESAKKYGVFTSLVMPHLYDDAELEATYGNMIRIVCDTGNGGWWHCSAQDKGKSYTTWPNCMNMFDGFTYWSHLSGRENVILDGDFIRLNKFDSDAERETVVSLQLMAGGPVTVADQYHNIGDNLKFYTNSELLELNKDRFVGKPLSDKLNDRNNEIWYGQMSNGDYVVGLFNRDDSPRAYNLDLKDLGMNGLWNVRDLWRHTDEGATATLSANIPAHGCKIVRLSKQ
ncbi:MAG: glucan 1,6-alpha-isomaltosidase [Muribaculum sp.]|nr:glucan 1,6-alpha-isomaltosidase [Muribaculum sp.]